ncbi:MAG: hypothetical protein ACPGXK_09295 [Phycisphaerae bacterium]
MKHTLVKSIGVPWPTFDSLRAADSSDVIAAWSDAVRDACDAGEPTVTSDNVSVVHLPMLTVTDSSAISAMLQGLEALRTCLPEIDVVLSLALDLPDPASLAECLRDVFVGIAGGCVRLVDLCFSGDSGDGSGKAGRSRELVFHAMTQVQLDIEASGAVASWSVDPGPPTMAATEWRDLMCELNSWAMGVSLPVAAASSSIAFRDQVEVLGRHIRCVRSATALSVEQADLLDSVDFSGYLLVGPGCR